MHTDKGNNKIFYQHSGEVGRGLYARIQNARARIGTIFEDYSGVL